jgi:hypothetical protein
VAALKANARRDRVRAQLFSAPQTPFAAAATLLVPTHTNTITDFARTYTSPDLDDFADGFVAKNAGKLQPKQTMGKMHVGVAQAAGLNLDNNLIRTGFGRLPLFDFPLAVNGRDNCCFHEGAPEGIYVSVGCRFESLDSETLQQHQRETLLHLRCNLAQR